MLGIPLLAVGACGGDDAGSSSGLSANVGGTSACAYGEPCEASGGSYTGTGAQWTGTGAVVGTGAASSGSASGSGGFVGTGGVVAGTGGSAVEECTDIQHPDHQGSPCSQWLGWGECNSAWLKDGGYCNESCGRCQSSSTGGSGNTGGSQNTGGQDGGMTLPNINGGQTGWASRYWDCCKPHCAWPNNGNEPSCAINGTSHVSSTEGSMCANQGNAYVCNSEAPRAVSSSVSYGYVAVPNPQCGACYHIQFTGTSHNGGDDPGSKAIAGKHMIVRVTNTGGDVQGGQFDLMVPGGGVGINPNTCPTQWGTTKEAMGPSHGGFLTGCSGDHAAKKACVRAKCNSVVPAGELRDACNWFVDWYQVANNPNFKVESIACPADI
jgi:hypothetical protein